MLINYGMNRIEYDVSKIVNEILESMNNTLNYYINYYGDCLSDNIGQIISDTKVTTIRLTI